MATILTSYYRYKPGGFCTRYVRAIRALLARGHTVHYLAVARYPIEHKNCHFHRFPWRGNTDSAFFWFTFYLLGPILLLALGLRYRITHLYAFGYTYGFILQPARLVTGKPLSVFLRGDAIAAHRLNGRSRITLAVETFIEDCALRATTVYGVSNTLLQRTLERHPHLKIRGAKVIANNIDVQPSAPRAASHVLRLGFVGALDPLKNHAVPLNALAGVQSRNFRATFFGGGPQEAALRSLAQKLGLADKVFFAGWIEPDKLWHQIDLLLFPSLFEGCPNAVLEAIAHSVPVLASDIPEHAELLPDRYRVMNTCAEWTQAIESLCADATGLARAAERQARYAKKFYFDWDDIVVEAILAIPT